MMRYYPDRFNIFNGPDFFDRLYKSTYIQLPSTQTSGKTSRKNISSKNYKEADLGSFVHLTSSYGPKLVSFLMVKNITLAR